MSATPQELVKQINAAGQAGTSIKKETASAVNMPEDKYPEFTSTTGMPIMVALQSGHTVAISADPEKPTKLHPRFHRRAIELGAMPSSIARQMQEQMKEVNDVEQMSSEGRSEIILKNISQMVSQADINPNLQSTLFTKDGRPDCEALTQRCGFLVRAPERDRMWEMYQGELA